MTAFCVAYQGIHREQEALLLVRQRRYHCAPHPHRCYGYGKPDAHARACSIPACSHHSGLSDRSFVLQSFVSMQGYLQTPTIKAILLELHFSAAPVLQCKLLSCSTLRISGMREETNLASET